MLVFNSRSSWRRSVRFAKSACASRLDAREGKDACESSICNRSCTYLTAGDGALSALGRPTVGFCERSLKIAVRILYLARRRWTSSGGGGSCGRNNFHGFGVIPWGVVANCVSAFGSYSRPRGGGPGSFGAIGTRGVVGALSAHLFDVANSQEVRKQAVISRWQYFLMVREFAVYSCITLGLAWRIAYGRELSAREVAESKRLHSGGWGRRDRCRWR